MTNVSRYIYSLDSLPVKPNTFKVAISLSRSDIFMDVRLYSTVKARSDETTTINITILFKPFISNKGKVHPVLIKQIRRIINLNKPLLVFVPRIKDLPVYKKHLTAVFKEKKIVSVYAGDKERQSKVARFRNQEIDILLTTTILERGVTFKHVQVIVIAADDPIYNTPSLVQIAGRVGRSADDRDGLVLFCYHKYTKNIRQAMKQIRMMNK